MALHHRLPGVVEADDVRVLQALQHLHLLAEALSLRLGQLAGLRRKQLVFTLHSTVPPLHPSTCFEHIEDMVFTRNTGTNVLSFL